MLKIFLLVLFPSVASAAQDLTGVAINLTPVGAVLGIVFVAALAMFGYRKFIRTANRT